MNTYTVRSSKTLIPRSFPVSSHRCVRLASKEPFRRGMSVQSQVRPRLLGAVVFYSRVSLMTLPQVRANKLNTENREVFG